MLIQNFHYCALEFWSQQTASSVDQRPIAFSSLSPKTSVLSGCFMRRPHAINNNKIWWSIFIIQSLLIFSVTFEICI